MDFVDYVSEICGRHPHEPFCPFDGSEKVGYCDLEHPHDCINCAEALSSWAKYKRSRDEWKQEYLN